LLHTHGFVIAGAMLIKWSGRVSLTGKCCN
jgi:hypothetical protein